MDHGNACSHRRPSLELLHVLSPQLAGLSVHRTPDAASFNSHLLSGMFCLTGSQVQHRPPICDESLNIGTPRLLCRQRRDLIAYNESLRQQRIQALVQTQVNLAESAAEHSAGTQGRFMRPVSAPGAHPTAQSDSTFAAGPLQDGHTAMSFTTFSAERLQGGVGAQRGGAGMGVGGPMQPHGPAAGGLFGQTVAPGVTLWGTQSAWGGQWGGATAGFAGGQQVGAGTMVGGRP